MRGLCTCLVVARILGGRLVLSVRIALVVIFFLGEGLVFARAALLVYCWREVVVCSLLLGAMRLFVVGRDPPVVWVVEVSRERS